ncbi:hypothetical protein QQZ08_005483 [Neonectria magnoliae]|uniref:Uncharacterized protein n=1 Tax=Neonectria magnoliae TaxID=2732573 RepID=A0ABR1I3J5_9HYPO
MSTAAVSKVEADAEIEQLRVARGCGQGNQITSLTSSLSKALEIISDELYQNSTHFLLELIQNADDNKFPAGVTPSLSLTLSSESGFHHLRTDCNEIGFTFDNIDALIQVGKSTKKSAVSGQRGCIGEKGIGFKSVFKVADIIHVASGYYEFKLDRKKQLGMILPIPSAFPREQRLLNHTQFLLQLRSEEDYKKIQCDLQDMEPQLLIFLRNIQRLQIQTNNDKKAYRIHHTLFNPELEEIVTIHSDHQGENGPDEMKYVLVRLRTSEMPKNARREGVTVSEVILAFPIAHSKPEIRAQKVFAFLPIDDFGFKFLIHADFLLVASREGLDYDRPWNSVLRRALQRAFLTAVKRFNKASEDGPAYGLRYMWPKYIKYHRHSHAFWTSLHESILNDLRAERILESGDPGARLYKPPTLRYVPTQFRFGEDALFDCSSLRKTHLAFEYDCVHEELELLGVRKISTIKLYQEFEEWVAEVGAAGLRTKSPEWHRQVSRIFIDVMGLRHSLENFPIVPLRDGSWVSARTDRLYLASDTDDQYIPKGINLLIVDQSASQDPVRRRFYEFLGIQAYTALQVCNLILELHSGSAASMQGRQLEDMVMDAAYLFKYRQLLGTYISPHLAKPALIDKYKDMPGSPFYVLDDLYETMICGGDRNIQTQLHKWLLRSGDVSEVPILVRNFQLTPEWRFLRQVDVLDLLLVVEQVCGATPSDQLLEAVPRLRVQGHDGIRRPLGEMAIPTRDLVQACPHLPFAALPNPERLTFLSKFGILTSLNTTARLQELDALTNLPIGRVDKRAVHEIYRGLCRCLQQERHMIAEVFISKPLVFISRPTPEWVSHGKCVWSAPPPLKRTIRLDKVYSDCQKLFCDDLCVKPAGIEDVVDELCYLHEESPVGMLRRCEDLLMILQRHLPRESDIPRPLIEHLKYARIFPVLLKARDSSRPVTALGMVLKSLNDKYWYVPDRLTLETAFRGKVDILGFSLRSVKLFEPLFSKLGLQKKHLSSVVKETVDPRGTIIRDMPKDQDLNTRVEYFARCLGSIIVEEDNELITVQEESTFTRIYFRQNIPQAKQPEVNYKLAEYFSKQYHVRAEDMNLFNLLLSAPLNDLDTILAMHNRFLPGQGNINGQRSSGSGNLNETTNAIDLIQTTNMNGLSEVPRVIDVNDTNVVAIEDVGNQHDEELRIITREEANLPGPPTRMHKICANRSLDFKVSLETLKTFEYQAAPYHEILHGGSSKVRGFQRPAILPRELYLQH